MNIPLLELIIIAVFYLVVFIVIENMQRRRLLDGELTRKFTHIVGGFLAAGLPALLTRWQIVGLMLVMAFAMLYSKRRRLLRSVHEVLRTTHGEVLFPLGIALLAIVEPEAWRFSYGVLIMGVSDALASIVGFRYGRRKYNVVGTHWKTYVGSTTFFACSALIGVAAISIGGELPLSESLWPAIVSAGILTLIEAGSSYGLDNLLLPTAAAISLHLLI